MKLACIQSSRCEILQLFCFVKRFKSLNSEAPFFAFQENIISNYIQTLEKLLPTVKGDFLVLEPNASELLGNFSELNEANKNHLWNVQQMLIR